MTIAVVTDSAAGLDVVTADRLGVAIAPMTVFINGEAHRDGELDPAVLVEQMEAGATVSTAPASPGEIVELVEGLDADEVVLVMLSSGLSVSFRSAQLASEILNASGARRVQVVDSRTAAGAQALVVSAAAAAATRGAGPDEVVRAAERARGGVRLVARIGSLEWLGRSGRVPRLAVRAGTALHVVPLFSLDESGIHRLRPSRTTAIAHARFVEMCRQGSGRLHVAAMHAGRPDEARQLLHAATQGVEVVEAMITAFGAGMVASSGPDLAGLAWWWED